MSYLLCHVPPKQQGLICGMFADNQNNLKRFTLTISPTLHSGPQDKPCTKP